MDNKITIFDYDFDWALKEGFNEPRSIPGYITFEKAIEFIGDLGVDGIELSRRYWEDVPTARIKKMVDDAGLPVASFIFYEDLVFPPGHDLKIAVDSACKQLDRTAELEAPLAMIISAVYKEDINLNEQRKWLIEGLSLCTEHAESLGITLCIENIDDPPVRPLASRTADCKSICEAIDSPSFRLIFDPGCTLFIEEDPIEALRIMADYVVHAHVKNSRPIYPGETVNRRWATISNKEMTGTVLDAGLVNISAVLRELKAVNFKGGIMIEYLGENDPRIALPYNLNYLRRQMAQL